MSRPPFFLDAFPGVAELYAASRPRYPEALFQTIAALAPATTSAWDCGTGNGQAALGLAAHFQTIYATDASAEQITQAAAHPRIEYRVAPAEDSGLTGESVDVVSVATALHWFDLERFYQEVRRVVRPQGLIAVYGYNWFYATPALDELTHRWLLEPIKDHWSPKIRLLWDHYLTIGDRRKKSPTRATASSPPRAVRLLPPGVPQPSAGTSSCRSRCALEN